MKKIISFIAVFMITCFGFILTINAEMAGLVVLEEGSDYRDFATEISSGVYSYKDGSFLFNEDTGTLTLTNYEGEGIFVNRIDELNIVLVGDNVLNCSDFGAACLDIEIDDFKGITGTGTLTIIGNGNDGFYFGPYNQDDTREIVIDTGKITIKNTGDAFKVYDAGKLTINSDLDISNSRTGILNWRIGELVLNSKHINIDTEELGIQSLGKVYVNVQTMDINVASYDSLRLSELSMGGFGSMNNIIFSSGTTKIKTMEGVPALATMKYPGVSQDDYEGIILLNDLVMTPDKYQVFPISYEEMIGNIVGTSDVTYDPDSGLFVNCANEVTISPKVQENPTVPDQEDNKKENNNEKENPNTGVFISMIIPIIFIGGGFALYKLVSKKDLI